MTKSNCMSVSVVFWQKSYLREGEKLTVRSDALTGGGGEFTDRSEKLNRRGAMGGGSEGYQNRGGQRGSEG
eukprot:4013355-Pyramimonas_sp.AAC.1